MWSGVIASIAQAAERPEPEIAQPLVIEQVAVDHAAVVGDGRRLALADVLDAARELRGGVGERRAGARVRGERAATRVGQDGLERLARRALGEVAPPRPLAGRGTSEPPLDLAAVRATPLQVPDQARSYVRRAGCGRSRASSALTQPRLGGAAAALERRQPALRRSIPVGTARASSSIGLVRRPGSSSPSGGRRLATKMLGGRDHRCFAVALPGFDCGQPIAVIAAESYGRDAALTRETVDVALRDLPAPGQFSGGQEPDGRSPGRFGAAAGVVSVAIWRSSITPIAGDRRTDAGSRRVCRSDTIWTAGERKRAFGLGRKLRHRLGTALRPRSLAPGENRLYLSASSGGSRGRRSERRDHNPRVGGSSPSSGTSRKASKRGLLFACDRVCVAILRRTV